MCLESLVKKLTDVGRIAHVKISKLNEKKINQVLISIKNTVLRKEINYKLSKLAVEETSLGNVADKISKNFNKTNNLINDLLKESLFTPKKNQLGIYKFSSL